MVLQFAGFLGAWNHPGALSPLLAATAGAFITTWTTFVPCFLWIFLGAPHVEQLRGNVKLTTALSAVTAAVVGVTSGSPLGDILSDNQINVCLGCIGNCLAAVGGILGAAVQHCQKNKCEVECENKN